MKVLVSNLNVDATEQDLEKLFDRFGGVESVKLIRGWDSYESRGLAVIEFNERTAGETALKHLNRSDYMEQMLVVSEIRAPRSFSSQTLLTAY